MAYDIEKYRQKREKVLGITGKGISFGTLSLVASLVILTGLTWLVAPKTIDWWTDRHLIDAIYRMKGEDTWTPEIAAALEKIVGVTGVHADKGGTRLTVTFKKTKADVAGLSSYLEEKGIEAVLLNAIPRQHRSMETKGG